MNEERLKEIEEILQSNGLGCYRSWDEKCVNDEITELIAEIREQETVIHKQRKRSVYTKWKQARTQVQKHFSRWKKYHTRYNLAKQELFKQQTEIAKLKQEIERLKKASVPHMVAEKHGLFTEPTDVDSCPVP